MRLLRIPFAGLLFAFMIWITFESSSEVVGQPTPIPVKSSVPTRVMTPDGIPVAVQGGAEPTTSQMKVDDKTIGQGILVPLALGVMDLVDNGPRMQRLKTLTYDRRPNAILRAWAPKKKEETKRDPDAPPPPKKTPDEEKLDEEILALQKAVALSDWAYVQNYFKSLYLPEAKAAYAQMLRSLGTVMMEQMPQRPGPPLPPQAMEKPFFDTEALIGLARCAPKLDKNEIRQLGGIVRQALTGGIVIEHIVDRLKKEATLPKEKAVFTQRQAARLLADAGQLSQVGDFLPQPEEALKAKDLEALNLLARHYQEKHTADKKAKYLEKAWEATLHILALEGPRDEKEEALKRAVSLASRIKEQLGQTWLDESFTKNMDRGMEILATLGGMVAQGIQSNPQSTETRFEALQLQKTAIDALLKVAPKQADAWNKTLTLLASNWLQEAEYSRQFDRSTGMGSRGRRDIYGNFYYFNPDEDDLMRQRQMMMQQGLPMAIETPKILKCSPSDGWLKRIDDGLRPKVAITLAQLNLKVNEEAKSFPYIESLAPTHPNQAKELVKEFLRVWTKNHDPNSDRNMYRNAYIYFYGFESRAESIPLTRSKQERNLVELAEWVGRIRKLNLGDIDEDMLARAFTACHSSAEVYKTEAIETVFGPLKQLQPRTMGSLAQTMRGNLAGLWRLPAEQEKKKTKRKQKDIEAEVRRGYEVALNTVENGLKKFPDHWALTCAKAALIHDQINYESEIAKSSNFSARRNEAFALFKKAAEQYRTLVESKTLTEDEETTQVFDQWFYASMGAVDLGAINEDKVADFRQPPVIQRAMLALPGDAAKRHRDNFARALFSRMSSAKPQIKFRYLKGGFEIIDPDNPQAIEAKKVFDYYKDLNSEIRLDTTVDGSTSVGHNQPFGMFVNLRHTRDIERESGGFGKYLQNQNSLYFSYNYGRPTADYRERFETAAKEALKEHFEVLSITFQSETVNSRSHPEYGWRVTPYAYVLMKPRGPQVDKIPPLRIDLDFLDTSGYVVLPVESAALPIDCKEEKPEPRPLKKLSITQTLDERQADKGKLLLEIKATGVGLIGPLEELLTFDHEGFEVKKTDDVGSSVTKFDEDNDSIAIVGERSWTIHLEAAKGQTLLPTQFKFGTPKVEVQESVYQRYVDADVKSVESTVSLERQYGKVSNSWVLTTIIAVGAISFGVIAFFIIRRRKTEENPVKLPDQLTPFGVIDILNRAKRNHTLTESQRLDIDQSLQQVEATYFSDQQNGHTDVNLRQLAEKWVSSAS